MEGSSHRKERPLGVTIISVLDAIAGLLLLLRAGAAFGYGFLLGIYGGPLASFHGLLAGLGVLFAIVGLVTVLLAWALWNGVGWAWSAGLAIAVLSSALQALSFSIVELAINVIVIVYLVQPNVRLYFGH
jgi:hypothetical protein